MARKEGPLRKAINDWFDTSRQTVSVREWFERVRERSEEIDVFRKQVKEDHKWYEPTLELIYMLWAMPYVWFGLEMFKRPMEEFASGPTVADFKADMEGLFKTAFDQGPFADAIDIVGMLTSEPILALFEELTPEDVANPRSFVRRLHGVMIGLALAPGIATTALEALSLGQIETPVEVIKSIYWNFGLGFLGWQSISPMMNAGMLSVLERHYAEKFRPTRFSAAEMRDLYALGEIDQARFEQGARELGWSEEDMQLWKKLAFKQMSESDINTLYLDEQIDVTEWIAGMRARGYDPADMPDLHYLLRKEMADEAITVTLSTAKRSLREGLMSEGEFRETMTDLGKSGREIELLIALERETAETELRSLTVSQIRKAWEENVLSDAEAKHWLSENRFGNTEIELIMRTWRVEIEPTFRKLNKGTILGAYLSAVFNREQAAVKLESIGFDPVDARLELDLIEARSPEVFGAPAPKPSRHIAPGMLSELLEAKLITAAIFKIKLLEQNYNESDAELLMQAAIIRAASDPRPLSDFLIQRAYAALVLTRELALGHLLELEFEETDANLMLDTVEAENPSVFAPETIQSIRLPTVGALVEVLRLGMIDDLYFYARMAELGYERESADMYLALALRTESKSVKALSKAEIKRLYDMEIFDRGTSMIRMMGLGYNNEDAMYILRTVKSGIEFTDVWNNMMLGLITVENAVEHLFSMGFTDDEITLAFDALTEEE